MGVDKGATCVVSKWLSGLAFPPRLVLLIQIAPASLPLCFLHCTIQPQLSTQITTIPLETFSIQRHAFYFILNQTVTANKRVYVNYRKPQILW